MSQRRAPCARTIRLLSLALVSSAMSGCAIPASVARVNLDVARDITPVAIEAGLRAMNDPANQRRLRQMVVSPEMKAVEQELISGLIDGSLASLSETDRAERRRVLVARYATSMLQSFSREMAPQLGPAVSQLTRAGVKGAMTEVLRPENQVGITTAVSSAMTHKLGPALQQVIGDNLALGIATALQREEVKRALGETAHLLGREVVLGGNAGWTEIQASRSKDDPSTLGSLSTLANKGVGIATGVTWVLGALVLVLAGVLVKLIMQARKLKSESEERVAATRLMTEAHDAD